MYRMISFIKGAAIGAGVMYFFDPVVGNRRRALLRDQFYHLANRSCERADARWRDMQNRMHGTIAEMRSSLRQDDPSDDVLHDRVRSAIGRTISHPRAIEVDVEDGFVTLSGPVLAKEVDYLLNTVESVRGVRGVTNSLDSHDSPANVPALQG
jgi:osmotically-inducible protein OsmY